MLRVSHLFKWFLCGCLSKTLRSDDVVYFPKLGEVESPHQSIHKQVVHILMALSRDGERFKITWGIQWAKKDSNRRHEGWLLATKRPRTAGMFLELIWLMATLWLWWCPWLVAKRGQFWSTTSGSGVDEVFRFYWRPCCWQSVDDSGGCWCTQCHACLAHRE